MHDTLARHVGSDARCRVSHAAALGVLLRSIVVEREPIYRQQETVHEFAPGMFWQECMADLTSISGEPIATQFFGPVRILKSMFSEDE